MTITLPLFVGQKDDNKIAYVISSQMPDRSSLNVRGIYTIELNETAST